MLCNCVIVVVAVHGVVAAVLGVINVAVVVVAAVVLTLHIC